METVESIGLTVDGAAVSVPPGSTILEAATAAGVYVPTLCWHPGLAGAGPVASVERVWQGTVERRGEAGASFNGCDLCVVEIEGRADAVHACWAKAEPGMAVRTATGALKARRRATFARLLGPHPHACLSCAKRHGCPREPCPMNVPVAERCCPKLGRCQIEALYDDLGFAGPLPPFVRDERLTSASALFACDWNLCVGCLRCVRVCQGVRQVGALGFTAQDGLLRVGFTSATPDESDCRFCGACVEVCPTGALMDRAVAGEPSLAPCLRSCPAGLDVPSYLRAIAAGDPEGASALVADVVPFGRVLGRVCHAPCRKECRRGALGDPVSNAALKRWACDAAPARPAARGPATGKSVAVVGAGPAGLTAAWSLARKGHAVTVFEARSEPGGMLRWAIPTFRLPSGVVRDEVEAVRSAGVEIRASTRVSDPAGLRREFDAVLLATGLPKSRRLGIPGEELPGVLAGLDFLGAVAGGDAPRVGPSVIVLGGGNVAVDAAVTAACLGAHEVTLACLEAPREMSAFDAGLTHARAEGVRFRNGWGPAAIRAAGPLRRCEFRRCTAVFDAAGRFAPAFDDADRLVLEAQTVIVAIGQRADETLGLHPDAAAGLFAAGDAAGPPFTVVNATASGNAAAAAIDRFLGGDGILRRDVLPPPARAALGHVAGFSSLRALPPAAPHGKGFEELAPAWTAEEARREAARCLQCDLRLTLGQAPMPPAR